MPGDIHLAGAGRREYLGHEGGQPPRGVIFSDEELADALRAARLAPLQRLRPAQQDRLAETLLAWLQHGCNANEVAQHVHVHPQTVRYRLRQVEDLFGDQLRDPDRRSELEIALRARHMLCRPGS